MLMFLVCAPRVNAFSLLGPYTDWMVQSNGYQQAGDIGGPMDINEEYRWDVPVVTYGFDQSFVDYFGSKGVAAVESAIQTLNDLPAASDVVLTNFPMDTRRVNYAVAAQGMYDLKSTTLTLLVEHLGLGQPVRNIVDIKTWNPSMASYPVCGQGDCANMTYFPDSTIQRNFDPQTLAPSFTVNGTAYSSFITTSGSPGSHDYVEMAIDPQSSSYSAVADDFSLNYSGLQSGSFYEGLTRDDVGGLSYLLNATNVNWESLPKDVLFTGNHAGANRRLRGAWRPGVEKITFSRQPQNKRGKFTTAVFKFTAYYVTNGVTVSQPAKRVVSQPDILFSAAETYTIDPGSPMFLRSGTTNWINNASENGDTNGAGPGVISSSVNITFDKLGPTIYSGDGNNPASVVNSGWASFDASINPPAVYPPNTGQTNLAVRLHFFDSTAHTEITNSLFPVPVSYGSAANVQISTNQTDWTSLATVTNTGSVVRWYYFGDKTTAISFRVVPASQ